MTRVRPQWVLPVSILVALLVMLVPVPPAVQPLRPYWLALVLAYWVIEDPDHVGLGLAFIIGLLGDLVTGSLLGEQAMRLVVMARPRPTWSGSSITQYASTSASQDRKSVV